MGTKTSVDVGSANRKRSRFTLIAMACIVYLSVFLVAGFLDLYTTGLALRQPGTTEGNVYAKQDAGYSSTRAWVITVFSAVFIEGFLVFSLWNAPRMAEHWLRHPLASWGKFYVLPWSKDVLDRSPLHMLSFVVAFIPLRLLAAANNLLIVRFGTAPLGRLVGLLSNHLGPTLGFWLVLGPLFYLLAIACSPFSAHLIRRFEALKSPVS